MDRQNDGCLLSPFTFFSRQVSIVAAEPLVLIFADSRLTNPRLSPRGCTQILLPVMGFLAIGLCLRA